MTLDELHAAWLRWMHRKDIEADLAVVDELTLARIQERLMYIPLIDPPPEDLLAWFAENTPRLVHHAGLVSLHQLAQDDEGLSRELGLFDQAMKDHHFRRSIDRGPAVMPAGWA